MRAQKTCFSATASPRFAWQGSSKSSRSSTMPRTAFSSSRCRHPACRTGSVCRIRALSERQRRTGCQPSLRLRGTYHAALLDGECTVRDGKLFSYLKDLCNLKGIFLEPSACAGFEGISAVGSVLSMLPSWRRTSFLTGRNRRCTSCGQPAKALCRRRSAPNILHKSFHAGMQPILCCL